MTSAHAGSAGRSFVTFLTAFVAVYAISVGCAVEVFSQLLTATWPMVASFRIRLITAMSLCPVASALVGTWAASVRLLSYGGLGRDHITRTSFFAMGWVAVIMGNYVAVSAVFGWALPSDIGSRWVDAIGVERFNFVMLLIAPTLAFAAGCAAVTLLEAIVMAQRG